MADEKPNTPPPAPVNQDKTAGKPASPTKPSSPPNRSITEGKKK
jgi:hypothetical protein